MGKIVELLGQPFLDQLRKERGNHRLNRDYLEDEATLSEIYAKATVNPCTVRQQFLEAVVYNSGATLPCGGSAIDFRAAFAEPLEACLPLLPFLNARERSDRELIGTMLVVSILAWDFDRAKRIAVENTFEPESQYFPGYMGATEIQSVLLGDLETAVSRIREIPRPISSDNPPIDKNLAEGVVLRDAEKVKIGLKAINNRFKRRWTLNTYATPAKLRHYGTLKKMLPDIRQHLCPRWLQSTWGVTWMSLAWHLEFHDAFSDPDLFSEWIPWELCCPEPLPNGAAKRAPAKPKAKSAKKELSKRAQRDLLFASIVDGDLERTRELVESSVDLNAVNRDRHTPLIVAAHAGWDVIGRLVLRAGADADLLDLNGRSVLGIAASKGDLKFVDMLLKEGVKPDHAGKPNRPLFDACATGHLKVVKRLLKAGADPSSMNDDKDGTPLTDAIDGEIESEAGANYVGGEFMEPGGDYVGIVRELLKHGAKSNIRLAENGNGTALHTAAGAPSAARFVKLLLAAGAKPNLKDEYSETPLHIAARYGEAAAVRSLLAAGAKKSIRNEENKTPFDLAAKHPKTQKLLA